MKSLEIIGTTPSQNQSHRILELAAACKFENLQDFFTKEIGLEIVVESLAWMKSYDFFGSDGCFVNYLRTGGLLCDLLM